MKIYLASPLGFTESTIDFMNKIENKLKELGHEVLNPWKLDPIVGERISKAMKIDNTEKRISILHNINLDIGYKNEKAIKECDIIFAILDGTDVDSGTASEIGFGFGIGKKIIGYRGDFRLSADNEGSIVNLQVQYWIEMSGGIIIRKLDEIESSLERINISKMTHKIEIKDNHGNHCIYVPKVEISHLKESTDIEQLLFNLPEEDIIRLKEEIIKSKDPSYLMLLSYFEYDFDLKSE